ncbi:MAG: glycine cleavage system aminomethyltransferase GcvT, partial [Candidatus Rokubacteria bacterium]|nr:glycine cleavage system aminomethyltransferase GcvT [Candidatus Rokubacteria bacterium]
ATWRDLSAETALLAVQGPRAEALVGRLADTDVAGLRYYHFATGTVAGVPTTISRTGYTGEDGFELYAPAARAERLWGALMAAGQADGIRPVGLGARDTLRLEMKFALYGNDIDETTNPLEAGLGWVVKPAKGEFIGRSAIEAMRAAGVPRKLVGFAMEGRAVARHGYPLQKEGRAVGVVTSGSFAPSLERPIGMGYVPTVLAAVDTELDVEIRGATHRARVVRTPFHPSRVKKG